MSYNLLDKPFPQLLKFINWPLISKEIENFGHFKETRDFLSSSPVKSSRDKILESLERIDHLVKNYIQTGDTYKFEFLREVNSEFSFREVIGKVEKEAYTTLLEINYLVQISESFFKGKTLIKSHFKDLSSEYFEISDKIKQKLIMPWRQFVDPSGEVHYQRHPILGPIYKKIIETEGEIRTSLSSRLKDTELRESLQMDQWDIVYDHFVLAIRADHYRGRFGKIISRSSSGQTLYVEPTFIRELNHKREELKGELEEREAAISREFIEILNSFLGFLFVADETLKQLDLDLTKANYSFQKGFCKPVLRSKPSLRLDGFFHPLLESPVKNDIACGSQIDGIVISGPNTGGKTVALKAICLSQLFLHWGMFVPADEAELYPYDTLFFFAEDQQNLAEGLSSFSSEALNYQNLVMGLKETNLILIDEIFNSTSSDEASALALSFMRVIAEQTDSLILLSTHHQLLKTIIHKNSSYISAHMEFDSQTNQPTYKIIMGTPGSSQALNVFEKISPHFPYTEDILASARTYLDKKHLTYESLLEEVSKQKGELSKILFENKEINTRLKNQEKSMEGVLRLKSKEQVENLRDELFKIKQKALKVLEKVKTREERREERVLSELNQLERELPSDKNPQDNPRLKSIPFSELKPGMRIYSVKGNEHFEVKSIDQRKKTVLAKKGVMQITLKEGDIFKPLEKKPIQKQQLKPVLLQKEMSVTLDGRGMRLDEFKDRVEESILYLKEGAVPYLEIIHGHGTGALKSWLRKYLRDVKGIEIEIPSSFNDGVTRIKLN